MNIIKITPNEANQRLDRFLRKYLKDIPLSEIYKLLRKKSIKVNGEKAKENYMLSCGDTVEIGIEHENKQMVTLRKTGMDFKVIFEDENVLIVDKPPELILHPDIRHKDNTLVDQVLYYLYSKGEYIPENEVTFSPAAVNRLDLNTGGIVLFAKNYESLQNLSVMVKDRYLKKYYICIVKGRLKGDGEIRAYLTKDHEKNKVKISDEPSGKEIHTKYRVLKESDRYSLVEIDLITGRSHQIRAQLSQLGYPIIGDMKYGDEDINNKLRKDYRLKNQFLYAYRVYFEKGEGNLGYLEGKSFNAKLPEQYRGIIKNMFGLAMED